ERQSARIPVPVSGTSKETNYLKGKPYLHFIEDRVKNELASKGLNEDALRHDGAKIYLTIDPKAEQQAADASHKIMSHDKGAGQKYLDSSLVSADPKTGAIIAYYGGNWNISQLDMANHAHMPGSSFKPIDFASAMQQDRSIGIGTTYDGTPNQTIQGQHVNNAGNENCGKNCSVQRGMTQSVNTVFYNMVAQIHSPNVRKTAWQLGVPQQYYDNGCKKNMPTLTSIDHKACKPGIVGGGISIGGYPVAPRDMVQAYATLANGGNKMPLHFVSKVTDNTGQNVLYQSAESAKPVLDPQNPDHNKKIARNVTQSMLNVARYSGDALDGGRPVASKTGTAQYGMQGHNQAAWMIGYTPSVVTGVWVGNADRPSPIFGNYHNGKGPEHHYDIYGREEPAYIWKAFMDSYLKGTPNEQFSPFEPLGNSTVNDAVYSTNSGSTSDSSSNSGSSNNTSTQYSGSQSTPTTVPPTQPTHPTQPTAPPVTSQPAKPPPTTGGILPPVNNGRGNGNGGG
ncbi:MAG: transglycosylase domain-containing protein, partial [Sciscionella sp.]